FHRLRAASLLPKSFSNLIDSVWPSQKVTLALPLCRFLALVFNSWRSESGAFKNIPSMESLALPNEMTFPLMRDIASPNAIMSLGTFTLNSDSAAELYGFRLTTVPPNPSSGAPEPTGPLLEQPAIL